VQLKGILDLPRFCRADELFQRYLDITVCGLEELECKDTIIVLPVITRMPDTAVALLIQGLPRRYFFERLSFFATEDEEKTKLRELSSPEGADLYHEVKRSGLDNGKMWRISCIDCVCGAYP